MKARVPIAGTVGKSISFDPRAGARAEAAVAALAAQINAGLGGNILHSSLQGLQIGDDHPQYTGNQFPETITGQWNFQTIPFIQGNTLAEYIEDVVGGSFFDFLQDTTSVVWTYFDTAQHLEANVPPEFVQDVVGAMLVDTSTVDFTYDDTLGQISAVVPGAALTKTDDTNVTLALGGTPATALARAASLTLGWTGQLSVPRGGSGAATLTGYLKGNGTAAFTAVSTIPYSDISGTPTIPAGANPSASVGLATVNGSATSFMRSDGAPALSQSITPAWTGNHTWNDSVEGRWGTGNDMRLFHDGTNSFIRNDTGQLRGMIGGTTVTSMASRFLSVGNTSLASGYSGSATLLGVKGIGSGEIGSVKVESAGTTNLTKFEMFAADSAAEAGIFVETLSDMAFYTNGAERMRILAGGAALKMSMPLRSKAYTVATLPTGVQGDRAHVTDALAPTFGTTVVGGGAVVIPVFYNGTTWVSY